MTDPKLTMDSKIHRQLAADLFNSAWDLMEKSQRTHAENDRMINTAHASRFHWGIVGTPLNFARGEWQISRCYSLAGRYEPALHHARNSLNLCLENELGDFDLGFAYEALARAYSVAGNVEDRDRYVALALAAAGKVKHDAERNWLTDNINTVVTALSISGEE